MTDQLGLLNGRLQWRRFNFDGLLVGSFTDIAFVMLTMLAVKGYTMVVGPNDFYRQGSRQSRLDRDALLIPEQRLETLDARVDPGQTGNWDCLSAIDCTLDVGSYAVIPQRDFLYHNCTDMTKKLQPTFPLLHPVAEELWMPAYTSPIIPYVL